MRWDEMKWDDTLYWSPRRNSSVKGRGNKKGKEAFTSNISKTKKESLKQTGAEEKHDWIISKCTVIQKKSNQTMQPTVRSFRCSHSYEHRLEHLKEKRKVLSCALPWQQQFYRSTKAGLLLQMYFYHQSKVNCKTNKIHTHIHKHRNYQLNMFCDLSKGCSQVS